MKLSISPKFFQSVPLDALAPTLRDTGLDACNLVIREGFWCEEVNLDQSVPQFVKAMDNVGLACDFATWAISPDKLLQKENALRILADNGITGFRMGYFRQEKHENYPAAISRCKNILQDLCELCQRIGLQAVYQVHHGVLSSSPESAALLCDGLPPESVSIMLDSGNQQFEGACDWIRADRILGDSWTHLGVKDVRYVDGVRDWCACQDGLTDFNQIIKSWRQRRRPGF